MYLNVWFKIFAYKSITKIQFLIIYVINYTKIFNYRQKFISGKIDKDIFISRNNFTEIKLFGIIGKFEQDILIASIYFSTIPFHSQSTICNARCGRFSISIHWKTFNKRKDRGIVCIPVIVTSGIRVII